MSTGLAWIDDVVWTAEGLVPAIAQDHESGRVLMMAWMNEDALAETVRSGEAVYWSRSRRRLWRKGESSGHTQSVREISLDCDGDTVLLKVVQRGGIACHTGRQSCFYRRFEGDGWREAEPIIKAPEEIYPDGAKLPEAGR